MFLKADDSTQPSISYQHHFSYVIPKLNVVSACTAIPNRFFFHELFESLLQLTLFSFFFLKAICFLNWKTHNRTHSGETEWNSSNVSASSIHTAANESVWRVWNWEPSSRAASPGRTGLLLALEPVPPVDRAQLITKQLLQSTTKCIKILRYVLASFNIILEELLLRLECL